MKGHPIAQERALVRTRERQENIEHQRIAVHRVLRHAHDAADARHLLDLLGLLDTAEQMRKEAK